MPRLLKPSYEIQKFEMKEIRFRPELHFMTATLVSQINGCSFCVDIGRAIAVHKHVKMDDLDIFDCGTSRSPRMESAPRSRMWSRTTRYKPVSEATFEALRKHPPSGRLSRSRG